MQINRLNRDQFIINDNEDLFSVSSASYSREFLIYNFQDEKIYFISKRNFEEEIELTNIVSNDVKKAIKKLVKMWDGGFS